MLSSSSKMLTIFCAPKPFKGRAERIQDNAIGSWARLEPRPEILIFGDEEGSAEAASRHGARHIPALARNEHGTPLVSALFEQARSQARNSLLCYVNADIILLSDLIPAAAKVSQMERHFMLCGRRWDIDMPEGFGLGASRWEEALRALVAERGRLHGATGIDYFLFPKGLFERVPPFALGRTAWDNWLLFEARRKGAALIDATKSVTAVHQNHDYSHAGGHRNAWKGPEAERNRKLMGKAYLTLDDADHILNGTGVRRVERSWTFDQRCDRAALLHPWMRPGIWVARRAARWIAS